MGLHARIGYSGARRTFALRVFPPGICPRCNKRTVSRAYQGPCTGTVVCIHAVMTGLHWISCTDWCEFAYAVIIHAAMTIAATTEIIMPPTLLLRSGRSGVGIQVHLFLRRGRIEGAHPGRFLLLRTWEGEGHLSLLAPRC